MVGDTTFQKQTCAACFTEFIPSAYPICFSLHFNKNDFEPAEKAERILSRIFISDCFHKI